MCRHLRLSLAAKDTLRTDLSISDEMVPSTKPWMALPSGCIAGSQEVRRHYSGRRLPCYFGRFCQLAEGRKELWGLPPIHFGRADGVERTLLRVACQSETFLAPPWQGGIDIRVLWHIGCQSDFDELVSMSSRPVARGSGRMESISTTFHPVKGGSGRMGSISTTFHPVKGGFGRIGMHI